MPAAVVKSYAEKHGLPVAKVERRWERAVKQAEGKFKRGSSRFWAYTMGIFKKMMGEQLTLKDYLNLDKVLTEDHENEDHEKWNKIVLVPTGDRWQQKFIYDLINDLIEIWGRGEFYHRYNLDHTEMDDQVSTGGPVEFFIRPGLKVRLDKLKERGIKIQFLSSYTPRHLIDEGQGEELEGYRKLALERIDELKPFLKELAESELGLPVEEIKAVGSVVDAHRFKPESDIDVAFYIDHEGDLDEELSMKLQEVLVRHPIDDIGVINCLVFRSPGGS